MYTTYSKQAAKSISKINNPFKQKIKEAIETLPAGDVKKLQGYTNTYRLRVGEYRILFEISEQIIVLDILPRGSAYKN
ncbi:MAG: type II toxin-antitoxin system RelE/ParE family toxin [Oscillospiraceae bacterium]|nr:type II toxin-antitoxin system RelE/ParE family toxin [Oscillospiraceae bacterium]